MTNPPHPHCPCERVVVDSDGHIKATHCQGKPLAQGWCAEHQGAQTLLDVGERFGYPRIQVMNSCAVGAGRRSWQAHARCAPARWLQDDLRFIQQNFPAGERDRAMHYIQMPNGLGSLTGDRRERLLPSCMSVGMQETLRYKVGGVTLNDGIERFSYQGMVSDARSEMIQASDQSREASV